MLSVQSVRIIKEQVTIFALNPSVQTENLSALMDNALHVRLIQQVHKTTNHALKELVLVEKF